MHPLIGKEWKFLTAKHILTRYKCSKNMYHKESAQRNVKEDNIFIEYDDRKMHI